MILRLVYALCLLPLATDANYCSREGCNGLVQGGEYCNRGQAQCEEVDGNCQGQWCPTGSFSYCSPDNSCDGAFADLEFCHMDLGSCEGECRGKWCTNGGDGSQSPTITAQPSPPPSTKPSGEPTLRPSAKPTDAPSSTPTIAPTRAPTSSPTTAPTLKPTAEPDDFCCSRNYKDCDVGGWCGATEARCEQQCGAKWIMVGSCSAGIAKYQQCDNDENVCCTPGRCEGNDYYKQCV